MYTAVPQEASNFVAGVDLAFMVILGISAFFLIGLLIWALRVWKPEQQEEDN